MKPYQPPIPANCNLKFTRVAVMWYLVKYIPVLRPLQRRQLQKLGNECSRLSGKYPLHMVRVTKQFKLKNYPETEKEFTPLQVIAVMIACIWIMQNEDQRLCSEIYETWPIQDALDFLDMAGANPIIDVPLQRKRKPKNVRSKIIEVTSYTPKHKYNIRPHIKMA